MKNRIIRSFIAVTFAFFTLAIATLAFIPHTTCGCGQVEDGTQLTRIINGISEKLTGKRVFKKSENSLR